MINTVLKVYIIVFTIVGAQCFDTLTLGGLELLCFKTEQTWIIASIGLN